MNDILIRLREPKVIDPARGMVRQASVLECEAADEIERLRSQQSKSGTNEDRWRHGYQDGLEVAARFMESRKVSASPFYAAELRKLAQAPGVPDGSLVTMPNGSRMYALGPCGDEEPESPPKPNSSEGA